VFRNTTSDGPFADKAYDGSSPSCTDEGLHDKTEYFFKVQAIGTSGSSPLSEAVSGTTGFWGLIVGSATTSSLTVSWNSVEGATSYQLFRDSSPTGSFSYQVYDGSTTHYTDEGLVSGTTYYYKVRAMTGTTAGSFSAPESGVTVPSIPSGLNVGPSGPTSLAVSWDPVTGAESYQLYRDVSSSGPFAIQIYSGNMKKYTDGSLSSGTTYYYKVRASNAGGSGDFSAIQSYTTPPPSPTGLNVGNTSATELTIAWNPVNGVVSYQLFRDSSSTGSFDTQIYSGSITQFVDASRTLGTAYYYEVQATNSFGSSAKADPALGRTIGTIPFMLNNGWEEFATNDPSKYRSGNIENTGSHLTLSHELEVQVRKLSGSTSGELGVLFNVKNFTDWRFVVRPSGQYGIFTDNQLVPTIIVNYTNSTAVNPGLGQTNDLKVYYYYNIGNAAQPYTAVFSINGQTLYTYPSATPFVDETADIGFYAEVGSQTQENFPSEPVDDLFKQILPDLFPVP
jgi:hypothetical protein